MAQLCHSRAAVKYDLELIGKRVRPGIAGKYANGPNDLQMKAEKAAKDALVQIGKPAVDQLIAALNDQNQQVQYLAKAALQEIGGFPATEALKQAEAKALEEAQNVNRKRLSILKSYIVGTTTHKQFMDDKWNTQDPLSQTYGIVGFRRQSGVATYIIGYYQESGAGVSSHAVFMGTVNLLNAISPDALVDAPPLRWFGNTMKPGGWDAHEKMVAIEICGSLLLIIS